jgi:Na+/proline symporter
MVSLAQEHDKFHTFNWTWDVYSAGVWVAVIGGIFASAYPAMADQTVVQRYLSTADVNEARKALYVNAALTIPIQFLFLGIGTALWAYYTTHPGELDPELQNNAILPYFVIQQFPAGLKGMLIAGLFAASMSSLDSSMNSLSSVIVNDYYRRFVPGVSDLKTLRIARGVTLFLGVFGTFSALYVATRNQESTLFITFLKLLGLVGGGLAGIFVLGTLTKRANGIGAIVGGVTSGVVMYFVRGTEVHFFLHGMIGFLTAFVVGYGVSVVVGSRKASG